MEGSSGRDRGVFNFILSPGRRRPCRGANGQEIQDHEAARSLPLHSALRRVAGPALMLDCLVVGPTRSWLTTQQGGAVDGGGEGSGEPGGTKGGTKAPEGL